MKKLRKILLEIIVGFVVLIVAGGIILFLFTQNITPEDTFKGNVEKVLTNISSPVYGQILTVPVQAGDTVHKGQTLATIHVLSSTPIPTNKSLYRVNGTQVTIQSPSDGIVGQIALSPLSTVNSESLLMELYTASSFGIEILFPQGYDVSNYGAFYASRPSDQHRYALRIIEQIPTNGVSNADPTMSVYRATCTNCQAIFDNESVVIYAQHKQPSSPILDGMRSLLNQIQKEVFHVTHK